jgi:hypothetical protein
MIGDYLMNHDIQEPKDNIENVDDALAYEKDPKFIEYMRLRLDRAIEDREAGKLVDSEAVFADIRSRYGW